MLAALLATLGGREAVQVSRLSGALGQPPALLVAIWLSALVSSAAMAWAGTFIAPLLFPQAKLMFVAFALLLGGLEIWFLRPPAKPKEPTRSFGAHLIVLTAAQMGDGTRFLVAAFAVASGMPWLAAAGGVMASGLVLTGAWAMAEEWEGKLPLGLLRGVIGGLFVIAGIIAGLNARGLLG
ncbi:TMEM165/GDT1 family protein [Croceibacterium xixiisoli]|nr:TMEM165/GDT1 family protein [Croceibacterium xixiisoli]